MFIGAHNILIYIYWHRNPMFYRYVHLLVWPQNMKLQYRIYYVFIAVPTAIIIFYNKKKKKKRKMSATLASQKHIYFDIFFKTNLKCHIKINVWWFLLCLFFFCWLCTTDNVYTWYVKYLHNIIIIFSGIV